MIKRVLLPRLGVFASLALIVGCSDSADVKPPASLAGYYGPSTPANSGTLFGDQSLSLGINPRKSADVPGNALGVNAYLWRGALDTLSFMPLASADPFGGVIITDWYSPPGANDERFKATVYILGPELRADGIKLSLFRQTREKGQWVDAPVSPDTVGEITDKILARARQIKVQTAQQ